jgi:hypothetical protein
MMSPAGMGENSVRLRFTRTFDRTLGGIVSLLTAAALLLFWFRQRAKPPHTGI